MSTNEPNKHAQGSNASATESSEADFLEKQADEAKAAITRAMADARTALAEGIDPREWTRRYPVVALGSAVAAGFVAALLAIPSKEQQELKKMEKVRRALHPEVELPKKAAAEAKDAKVHESPHSFWSTLLREAISLIKPVLMSAVTAGITSRSQPANGQPSAPGGGSSDKAGLGV